MIYTPLTRKAMQIAYKAHQGQVDKAGVPYIFHPYHLAEQMEDEISVCVALLHDVVEDTRIPLEELAREFPKEIAEGVALLTHNKGEDYFDYIRRIKRNPVARVVKLADLSHNGEESRLLGSEFSKEQQRRRQEKYQRAREILLMKEENEDENETFSHF